MFKFDIVCMLRNWFGLKVKSFYKNFLFSFQFNMFVHDTCVMGGRERDYLDNYCFHCCLLILRCCILWLNEFSEINGILSIIRYQPKLDDIFRWHKPTSHEIKLICNSFLPCKQNFIYFSIYNTYTQYENYY